MFRRAFALGSLAVLAACGEPIVEPDSAVEDTTPPQTAAVAKSIIEGAGEDDDGVDDGVDNCPTTYNPDQADEDLDGVGDACEVVLEGDAFAADQAALDALAGVTQITGRLFLGGSGTLDLSPLSELVDVGVLQAVSYSGLRLGALTRLARARDVYLQGVSLEPTDFSALKVAGLFNFNQTSGISDLSLLSDLEQLSVLSVSGSEGLTSLEGIQGLPLEVVYLSRLQVDDITPISLSRLSAASFDQLPILSNVAHVLSVPLDGLYLGDLPALEPLSLAGTTIRQVRLTNLPISDLGLLAGATVEWVSLHNLAIEDLDGLQSLSLGRLELRDMPLLSDLSHLPGETLGWLEVRGAPALTTLMGVPSTPALRILALDETGLSSLVGLVSPPTFSLFLLRNSGLTSLEGLDFEGRIFSAFQNQHLADCREIIDWIQEGGAPTLSSNAPGCNSVEEILASADPGTTSPGTGVPVTPNDETTGEPGPIAITFDQVDEGGTTSVASGEMGGPGAPVKPSEAEFKLGNPPTYFDITTTATFSGSIQICIDYSGVSLGGGELELLHRVDGEWDPITDASTPEHPNPDPDTETICGTTTSLSPFLVAETNAAPAVTSVALPPAPILLESQVAITSAFMDENTADSHSAVIDWGDGTTSAGTVIGSGGSGTVEGAHVYAEPGVYPIAVTVDDGGLTGRRSSILDEPSYVVVYDPSAGFVTGGGWIDSPFGACTFVGCALDGSTVGKASFGFVSRHKRGASEPDGNTEFQFKTGDLRFKSTVYEWLVVAGSRAKFKGTGTINGEGDYGFMITAIDGGSGKDSTDKFRIKIVDRSTDEVVYDNKRGESDDGDAASRIGGGSIIIHRASAAG